MTTTPELFQVPSMIFRRASRLKSQLFSHSTVRKPAIVGQLALISHGKLQQESASHMPNLRRCLGHHGVFKKCLKAVHENSNHSIPQHRKHSEGSQEAFINSKNDSNTPHIRSQISTIIKALAYPNAETPMSNESQSLARANSQEYQKTTKEELQNHHFSSKILQGLKSLSRRKHLADDLAIG